MKGYGHYKWNTNRRFGQNHKKLLLWQVGGSSQWNSKQIVKILLGDLNAKIGIEEVFRKTTEKDSLDGKKKQW